MNNLVTNLKLSKKLKAIGVPQKQSTFMWLENNRGEDNQGWRVVKRKDRMDKYPFPDAFLTGELLQMIPHEYVENSHISSDSPADSLAQLLISLLEDEKVEPSECSLLWLNYADTYR